LKWDADMNVEQGMGVTPVNSEAVPDEGKVRAELVRQLYSHPHADLFGPLAAALTLTAALWNAVSHTGLVVWLACFALVQVVRYWLASAFRRNSPAGDATIPWGRWFAMMTACSGLLWGLTGVFLFPVDSLPHQFLLALFVAGVSAVGSVVYAATLECCVPAILLALLPLSGRYLYQRSEFEVTIGVLIFLFAIGLVFAGRTVHGVIAESIRLRFDRSGLIDFLVEEKARSEKLNADLEAEIQERKLIEAALTRSEARYRAVVETAKDVIWTVGMDLSYTYVSPSVTDLLGYTVEEIMSLNPLETLTPESRERVMKVFREEIETESLTLRGTYAARFEEIEQYRKDGSIVVLEITTTFLRGPDDRPTGILGISRDITDRKQAEEALRQSEEKYRLLVETAQEGIFVAQDAMMKFVNPRVEEVTGYSKEELLTGPGTQFIFTDDREIVLQNHLRRLRGEDAPDRYPFRIMTKQGEIRWVELESVLITWEGRPAVLCFAADMTDRKHAEEALQRAHDELESRVEERTADLLKANELLKREISQRNLAEEALRQSEERFRTVFETARDCVFIKDRNLRYTHINPAMLSLLESTLPNVRGLTDDDLFGEQLAARLKSEDLRVLGGQVIDVEHTLTMGGREVTFNSVKIPMLDSTGTTIGVCGIARDISERRAQRAKSGSGEFEFQSPAMRSTLHQARLAAGSDSLVLLLGESGSGKDYLAGYIHNNSPRARGPFFAINCAALARELAESELFGHEAGSFTGAQGTKRGLLELAEGGTLLLNEIGELSLALQAKLLTFLDTQSFTRVGGERKIEVNARLIAATNRDLKKEMEIGRFRDDLFHRLNVFSVEVPPFRERLEDLPTLTEGIIAELAEKLGLGEIPLMDARCSRLLANYHWPGNIRELRNVLERALILAEGKKIRPGDLRLGEQTDEKALEDDWSLVVRFPESQSLNQVTRELKLELVKEALRRAGGVRKNAADLLGVSRDALKHHVKSLGLK